MDGTGNCLPTPHGEPKCRSPGRYRRQAGASNPSWGTETCSLCLSVGERRLFQLPHWDPKGAACGLPPVMIDDLPTPRWEPKPSTLASALACDHASQPLMGNRNEAEPGAARRCGLFQPLMGNRNLGFADRLFALARFSNPSWGTETVHAGPWRRSISPSNPSWGTETIRPPYPLPSLSTSSNPSWGTETPVREATAGPDHLPTPHGEPKHRQRSARIDSVPSSNPSWGTETDQSLNRLGTIINLPTPHGEPKPACRIRSRPSALLFQPLMGNRNSEGAHLQLRRQHASNPSWGTETEKLKGRPNPTLASNPSWGTETRARGRWSSVRRTLPTPHGEPKQQTRRQGERKTALFQPLMGNRNAACPIGWFHDAALFQPLMGNRNYSGISADAYRSHLPTPHGEPKPCPRAGIACDWCPLPTPHGEPKRSMPAASHPISGFFQPLMGNRNMSLWRAGRTCKQLFQPLMGNRNPWRVRRQAARQASSNPSWGTETRSCHHRTRALGCSSNPSWGTETGWR